MESIPASIMGEPVSGDLDAQYCENSQAAVAAASAITAAARVAGLSPGYLRTVVDSVARACDVTPSKSSVHTAIRRDYESLKALAEREGWTDESPVDPDLLGPLWAEGEPEGWPIAQAPEQSKLHSLFRQHLESLGMKFTPESSQILDAIAHMDKLFQADELLERMNASGYRISKPTIYRTINLLYEAGVLQRWIKDSGAVYYQLYFDGVVGTQPEANMSPLSLYFDLDEFTPQQIAEFISKLSELYGEIGGDELIIDDCRILEMALVPEGV